MQRDVIKPAVNVGKGLASPFGYLAKADFINPIKETSAQITHNPLAYRNAVRQSNVDLGLGPNGKNLAGGLRKWAGNTAQIGLDVAAPGISKGVESGVAKIAPQVIPKIVPKVVSSSVTGATLGGPTNVASYVSSGQPITRQGLKQNFLEGAKGGAELGAASAIAPTLARSLSKQIHNLPDTVRANKLRIATSDVQAKPISLKRLTSYEGAPDKTRVNYYKQQILAGKPIKPVIAMKDSAGNLGIEDGKHRYQAYQELGIKRIPTKVTTWEQYNAKNQGGYAKIPGASGDEQPKVSQNGKSHTTTSNLDNGTAQVSSGLNDQATSSEPSVPEAPQLSPNAERNIFAQNPMAQKPIVPKPNVFVPKGRLEADPELQSLYDSAIKSQNLSPMEQLKAEDAITARLRERNSQAEQAALGHLSNGGTRDEAIKVYRENAPGVSQKMASYRVRKAAEQAKQSLNPNKHTENSEIKRFSSRNVKPGDYKVADQRYRTTQRLADFYRDRTNAQLSKLSQADRDNFIDHAQGVKPITEAKNPVAVQRAVDAFRKGADTMHALDKNWAGGETAHIKDFFPDYWADSPKNQELLQHKAEQDLEEQVGPEEWNRLTKGEKQQLLSETVQNHSLDTGNYSGFRNKARLFANQAEGKIAGFEPRFTDPRDAVSNYFNGAKLNIAPATLIKGAREADSLEQNIRNSIDLPGDKSFQISDKGFNALKHTARRSSTLSKPVRLGAKALRGVDTAVVKTIVANPLIHGQNQEFNALFSAAFDMPGNKGARVAQTIKNQMLLAKNATERSKWDEEFVRHGGSSPTYGKNNLGFIAKGLQKVGVSPKVSELSPNGMAAIEKNIRVALYKTAVEHGMKPEAAIQTIERSLGGPNVAGQFERTFGLFTHYLKTNVKLLGHIGNEARKGNLAPLIGISLGMAAYASANKVWQEVTGNPNADFRMPGVLGTAHQLYEAPRQIAQGSLPSVLTSHTNPLLTTGIEQIANRKLYAPLIGPRSKTNNLDDPGDRLNNVISNVFGPAYNIQNVQSGKSTAPEAVTNYLLGAYTPHAKGYQAAPNIPVLNSKGSLPGNGLKQQQQYFNALDNLNEFSSKSKRNEDAINTFLDRDKNSRGQTIQLSPSEKIASYTLIANNPQALKALQIYEKTSDTNHAPMWDLPLKDLKTVMNYEGRSTNDPEKQVYADKKLSNGKTVAAFAKINSDWYDKQKPFPGSKPPVPAAGTPKYPAFDTQTTKDINTYHSLTNPTAKGNFLDNHPDVVKSMDTLAKYYNQLSLAQGGLATKPYPTAAPDVQKFMDAYNAADKDTRKGIRNANPTEYRKMIAFYDALDLYSINQQGSKSIYQGEPDYTNKSAKAIKNIGEDFYVDQNGNYQLIPAGWMLGLGGSGYGGYGGHKTTPAEAAFKSAMRQLKTPLKTVGALPAPSKSSGPNFKVPVLKSAYHKPSVNTKPKSSLVKVKR